MSSRNAEETLKSDDETLNIDAAYTRPGVEEFVCEFKEKIEEIDMGDFPSFKFNYH